LTVIIEGMPGVIQGALFLVSVDRQPGKLDVPQVTGYTFVRAIAILHSFGDILL
jgi:hypothetical protein